MKEKQSFILYSDWENTFNKISKYEAGDLIQGIFEYMRTGEIPKFESFTVETVFTLLVETFKRDREKYSKVCERNAVNGAKRWNKNPMNADTKNAGGKNGIKQNPKNADNDSVNDNDSDNDTDIDNMNNISISSSPAVKDRATEGAYTEDFLAFWAEYPRKTGKGAAFRSWLKIRPTKKERADIKSALKWQKNSEQWTVEYGKFIPLPATYLNQRRWEDEPGASYIGDITDPNRYKEDESDLETLKLLEEFINGNN